MGAWGIGPFDNDEALDFIDALRDGDDSVQSLVLRANSAPYLEADTGAAVIAAIALAASERGNARPDLPEGAAAGPLDDETIRALSELGIRVCSIGEGSELAELFDDEGDLPEWTAQVAEMVASVRRGQQ